MLEISIIFLTWLFYSFIGGIVEITDFYIEKKKLALDRGYLVGPLIPIFGFGAIFMLWLVPSDVNMFVLFGSCVFICGFLEFTVSYVMEKIFHMRWWDYSEKRFNIDGRIELLNCLLFGVGGVIIIKLFHPIFYDFIHSIPSTIIYILAGIFFVLVLVDFIISTIGAFSLKSKITTILNTDRYDLHKENIMKLLNSDKFIIKRFLVIFPHITKFLENIKTYDFKDKK